MNVGWKIMNEKAIYGSLENFAPLLLTVIILLAVIYFFIKKITSPFSQIGTFFWVKHKILYANMTQKRKMKMKNQLKTIKIKMNDWKNKYSNNNKKIMKIKHCLDDLSKVFTRLNEAEYAQNILNNELEENEKEIQSIKDSVRANLFGKIRTRMKLNRKIGQNKNIKNRINMGEEMISKKKELLKNKISEMLNSINSLSE
jgi:hypothetical protein